MEALLWFGVIGTASAASGLQKPLLYEAESVLAKYTVVEMDLNAWNECDNVYGKMGRDYTLRPAAHTFHYFNQWMTGQPVEVLSDEPRVVVPFAVLHDDQKNWVLVNRTSNSNTALLSFEGPDQVDSPVDVRIQSKAGLEESVTTLRTLKKGVIVPPHPVTFFSIQ